MSGVTVLRLLLVWCVCLGACLVSGTGFALEADRMATGPATQIRDTRDPSSASSAPQASLPAAPSKGDPGRSEAPAKPGSETKVPKSTPLPSGSAEGQASRFLQMTDSIRRIESLGTLSTFNEGALGKDIWAGTSRSDVATLFPALPASVPSATVTDLLRRAMLTRADSTLLVPDEKIMPGADFLTLRLEQLLRQGAYQEALDLYGLLKDKPYHLRLARAGIGAMILSGNVALACLESRSLTGKDSRDSFWTSLDGWCAVDLEPAAGDPVKASARRPAGLLGSVASAKEYRFSLRDYGQLASLSSLERGVLVSRGQIAYAPDFGRDIGQVPADLLSIPLYDKNLPPHLRIRITAEGVRRGLLPVSALSDLYKDLAPPNVEPSAADTGLMALPFLFRTLEKAKSDQEKWVAVESALNLEPQVGWAPLFPFAGGVRELVPGKISPLTARRVAGLILRAGLVVPETWGGRIADAVQSGRGPGSLDAVLVDIAVSLAREDGLAYRKVMQALGRVPEREARVLFAIADGLKGVGARESSKNISYGKFNPLTGSFNYVMPSSVAYDFLVRGGEAKIPGQVILSSAIALQGAAPGEIYPGILGRVLAGYESVGLHHEARKLAVEAILGLLK